RTSLMHHRTASYVRRLARALPARSGLKDLVAVTDPLRSDHLSRIDRKIFRYPDVSRSDIGPCSSSCIQRLSAAIRLWSDSLSLAGTTVRPESSVRGCN